MLTFHQTQRVAAVFKRERRISDVVLCVLLAVVLGTTKASAGGQEFGRLDMIAEGMDVLSNVATRQGDSDRLFLLEQQTGRVRIVENGRLLKDPFLDIGDRLVEEPLIEEGLVGLAFPPDFARESRAYLTYIDRDRNLVLSVFRVNENADQAVASSERVLLRLDRSARRHHCGHIMFGPKDGALYLCVGDDRESGEDLDPVSQSLDTLKGKLLRIPLDVLADGAAANNPSDALERLNPHIVAYGLRNPWGFTFDPRTGDLFIPDIGWHAVEEINFLSHGAERANFGWPFAEGNRCAGRQRLEPQHVLTGTCEGMALSWPILEYEHDEGNCAVIGGEVYRGERHPKWNGVFVFADMCSGKVWALRDPEGVPKLRLILEGHITPHAVGKDAAGEIAIVHGGGAVYRLSFSEDSERDWRSVDEILFAMLLRQRREGTSFTKKKLDAVLNSESWQLGRWLASWYRMVSGWF